MSPVIKGLRQTMAGWIVPISARAFISVALILGLSPALAAEGAALYPNRNIRLIVPFPAGGLVDSVARLIQPAIEKSLGRALIIDNRPAASGTLATHAVAKAEADGYTLLLASSSQTVAPATNSSLPYDIEHDFAPVALVAQTPSLFVVNSQVAAKTMAEFVSLVKAQPNSFSYGTTGAASQGHLVSLLFSKRAGIDMVHVPYRGGAPLLIGIIAGEVQFAVLSTQIAMPQIESGNLRVLATGGPAPNKDLPGVPTLNECGFPGFVATQWVGLLAPAGTPAPIVKRLNHEINRVLAAPDNVAKLAGQGMTPMGGSADEFAKLISAELKQWSELARQANVVSDQK
jgi:tripartite-type tricarboxylate transporter receptor subunit TctC